MSDTRAQQVAKLERTGSSILAAVDDLERIACPECGLTGFIFRCYRGGLKLICDAPVADRDDPDKVCNFTIIVKPQDRLKLPGPTWAEPIRRPLLAKKYRVRTR